MDNSKGLGMPQIGSGDLRCNKKAKKNTQINSILHRFILSM